MFDKVFNPCYISLKLIQMCKDEADNPHGKQLVGESKGGVCPPLSFPMKQGKAVENPSGLHGFFTLLSLQKGRDNSRPFLFLN